MGKAHPFFCCEFETKIEQKNNRENKAENTLTRRLIDIGWQFLTHIFRPLKMRRYQ